MSVTFLGKEIKLVGNIPVKGDKARNFTLSDVNLSKVELKNYNDKNVILNIFPSIDTPVCALSSTKFNLEAEKLTDTEVICISADLPFALERFRKEKSLENVAFTSFFRSKDFAENYGVVISEGPLQGLAARAVIVLDKQQQVVYSELVSEVTDEPDYQSAVEAIKGA
ncbi:lipid hydroxy peroxidase, Tpx type [Vibrio harveyi]|uniref:thiol peroxidase n=1 Tax=Vibrio harveyi TaxID=669 RepID=UPI002AD93EDF|nr:thiol peroxidase [Vibrio harveyi]CAK6716842.1 lipid hydroxy peroxidase, Tpx type [Vibrio harveyi]